MHHAISDLQAGEGQAGVCGCIMPYRTCRQVRGRQGQGVVVCVLHRVENHSITVLRSQPILLRIKRCLAQLILNL